MIGPVCIFAFYRAVFSATSFAPKYAKWLLAMSTFDNDAFVGRISAKPLVCTLLRAILAAVPLGPRDVELAAAICTSQGRALPPIGSFGFGRRWILIHLVFAVKVYGGIRVHPEKKLLDVRSIVDIGTQDGVVGANADSSLENIAPRSCDAMHDQ